MLSDLRLPAIKSMWAKLAEQSDKEGWPAARFLAALAEHEIADRGRRRIERHLAEARLPVGKTLASFDFAAVPMVSKAHADGASVTVTNDVKSKQVIFRIDPVKLSADYGVVYVTAADSSQVTNFLSAVAYLVPRYAGDAPPSAVVD